MQYKLLGRTGLYVSRICLGAMTFGGKDSDLYSTIGGLDATESERLVAAALDAGVNFIDTANNYALGESEVLLGQAIRQRRHDVVIATKGQNRLGRGPNQVGQSRVHLMHAIEGSLQRLETDYIDLYMLHNFDPFTPIEIVLRTLDDAVSQGKIRYIGCSNFDAWRIVKALGASAVSGLEPFSTVQAYWSLAGRDLEREIVPVIEEYELGLMIWSPLAAGYLSGKYRDCSTVGRRTKISLPPVDETHADAIVGVLLETAKSYDASAAQVALAWLLSKNATTSVIIGAKRADQLRDNIGAVDLKLADADLARLDDVSATPATYPGWIQTYNRASRSPK